MRTTIPPAAGLGLKAEHWEAIEATRPAVGWFEVHPENYMGAGGPPHRHLERIRADYPLSLHGVGLSIGGDAPLDDEHLERLKDLCDRYDPGLVSEHLAWSSHDGIFYNDLLPLPYNSSTLLRVADHIDQMQHVLGRRILLENPSSYLSFAESSLAETTFLGRAGGAHRLWPAARRQQRLRLGDQSGLHARILYRRFPAPCRPRDPSRRACRRIRPAS